MKISQILARLEEVRERRISAEKLLEDAVDVLEDLYPLEKLPEIYEKCWKALVRRHLYDSDFLHENKQDEGNIEILFSRVARATINRKEFKEGLEPFKKAVENFIENRKAEEEKLERELESYYVEFFAEHSEVYNFIYGSDPIKQGFMEFLLADHE